MAQIYEYWKNVSEDGLVVENDPDPKCPACEGGLVEISQGIFRRCDKCFGTAKVDYGTENSG